ncbi:MAG: hypothetical protein JXR77_15225, partial [Lentisphaeria bacterium]|nr:hypothetical protein [Lentisphaeria bacterium]
HLFRRPALVAPIPAADFRTLLKGKRVFSFWGHRDTLDSAAHFAGLYLTPRRDRPALELSPDGYPMLDGRVFRDCWVLTPDYPAGFRPAIGHSEPIPAADAWRVLHITWGPPATLLESPGTKGVA